MRGKQITALATLLLAGAFAFGAAPPGRGENPFFPDGRHHDFGKVKYGQLLEHTFRVVNTSATPLTVIRIRRS